MASPSPTAPPPRRLSPTASPRPRPPPSPRLNNTVSLHPPPSRSSPPPPPPAPSFPLINHFFHQLGLNLAQHQIVALLFAAFIICSLISPTLYLYFSPNGRSPSSLASLRKGGRGEMPWELEGLKRQGLIASEDDVCWDRLSAYYQQREIGARVIRMEQVLVSTEAVRVARSGWGGRALSKGTLHRAYEIQKELERRLMEGEVVGLDCVRDGKGGCAVLSPLAWWTDEEALLQDQDIHRTLSLPSPALSNRPSHLLDNLTSLAVPLTTSTTLVGIGRDRQGAVKGAHHLSITFYLEDHQSSLPPAIGSPSEVLARANAKASWRRVVRDVVDGKGWETKRGKVGRFHEGGGNGQRVILKHLPHLLIHSNPRLLEDILFGIGYLLVARYVYRATRGHHQIHSRIGLLFAGIVQLAASGIMSLSVCWLGGWSIALVPWNLLGFLVLVCGVDNMLVLTNAVGRTDIGLPIPERVAVGLSAVGLETTVTLLVELLVATLLHKIIDIQVIRELVLFAAVVLVVDYFLEMIFFATILSIDIQRLELADLLQGNFAAHQQGSPPSEYGGDDEEAEEDEGTLAKVWSATKTVLRDRAARTSTFGFLFFINILLYSVYGPDHYLPAFCSETALSPDRPLLSPSLSGEIARSLQRGQRGDSLTDPVPTNAAASFWRLINPSNSSSVHLYVEPVSIVQFYDDGLFAPESLGGAIVETSWWLKAMFVLSPIAATIFVLYLLLLYLLKDADLLPDRRKAPTTKRKKVPRTPGPPPRTNITTVATLSPTSPNNPNLTPPTRSSPARRSRPLPDVQSLNGPQDPLVAWAGLDEQVLLWKKLSSSTGGASSSLLGGTGFATGTVGKRERGASLLRKREEEKE